MNIKNNIYCLFFGLILSNTALAQSPCNLIPNGDFDIQNGSAPTTGQSNVKGPLSGLGDVANWEATNYSTPDYYAVNAPAGSGANPNSTVRGAFSPYPSSSPTNGCIGLYTFSNGIFGTDRYMEYITQGTGIVLEAGVEYYLTMHAYKASASPDPTYATSVGMALTQNSPSDYSYTSTSSTGYSPRVYGSSADFSINSIVSGNQWTPITGTFRPTERKTYYVNIGNFQQANPPASQPQTQVYHYIDAVGLYKIPTAGPAVSTCPDTPVTIGTNCGVPGATYVWSIAGTNMPYVPSVSQLRVQPTATTTYTLTVTLPNQEIRTSSVTVTVAPAPTQAILLSSIDKCAKTATYQIMNYNPTYTYYVTPSNGLTLQQSNPVSASFSIQGASNSLGGSFTVTRSGCGTATTTTHVDFTPPSPGGYYTSGYGPSYSTPVQLTTYQYIDITNPQGGYVNVQLTNTAYTYSFTADLAGLYLANTTGKWTQFILKPGQAVNITATALNSPCTEVGRFVFIASKGSYSYRVAPNPVSDELTITANENNTAEAEGASTTEFEVTMYDRFGKQMKSQNAHRGKASFDVRAFPEGLYRLQIRKGKDAVSEQIQITH